MFISWFANSSSFIGMFFLLVYTFLFSVKERYSTALMLLSDTLYFIFLGTLTQLNTILVTVKVMFKLISDSRLEILLHDIFQIFILQTSIEATTTTTN